MRNNTVERADRQGILFESKLTTDQTAEAVPKLGMSWHRSFPARAWAEIDVVLASVAVEKTSGRFQFADKVAAFHTKTSISLVCASEEGGGSSSSIIIR